MGLFSSKKKTVVGTQVSRAIEDSALPNAIKTGTIQSLLLNGDQADYVMEGLVSSIGIRAERMYEYAKRSYSYGLPSGQFYGASQGRGEVAAVLSSIEGAAVSLDYLRFGPLNNLHIGWMRILDQYGYDVVTNQLTTLSAQKGFPVFLDDMVVCVPKSQLANYEAGALDQWGTPPSAGASPSRPGMVSVVSALKGHSAVFADTSASEDYVRVDYAWEVTENVTINGTVVPTKVVNRGSVHIPIPDTQEDYFHAKYTVGGTTKYWLYQVGTGAFPTLDVLFDVPPPVNGTFFPFAYFRYDKKSDAENTNTPEFKTSKKLVKYLGMDFADVAEAIGENPDIKDVQQAMLIMAVPAVTENELERRYLFSFFENLYMSQTNKFGAATAGAIFNSQQQQRTQNALVIQDRRFKMTLGNQGIFKRRVVGSLGSVGKHSSGVASVSQQFEYVDSEGVPSLQEQVIKYHYYRKQVSSTLYDELVVTGLQMQYYVIDNYFTTGDESDDILLIPIDRSVVKSYLVKDKEELYARSLHYVFNSMQIIKIKWYQTGIFKVIMFIVAVIMAIYDGGATLGTYLGLTGAAAIIATVIIGQLLGLVLAAAFKIFVKVFSKELASLIAIVAVLYGGYKFIQSGGVPNAPWVKELLEISAGLHKAVMAENYLDLQKEYSAFSLHVEEQTKTLDKAEDLLNGKNHLSPFVIFGEVPNDFYNRTIHAGNIGMNAISAISSYVDIALRLPEINDTIGENTYGSI